MQGLDHLDNFYYPTFLNKLNNPMQQHLSTLPVITLKGVGEKMAGLLAKKGIYSLQDLLLHLPMRYQDRTRVTALRDLRANDYAVIEVNLIEANINLGKRRTLLCQVSDGTGKIHLRFFNFSMAQKNNLKKGERLRCFGEARLGPKGLEMVHPEYRHLKDGEEPPIEEHLTPIYPTTDGLTQNTFRRLLTQALRFLEQGSVHELPAVLTEQWQLPSLKQALQYCHAPPPDVHVQQLLDGTHPMQQRLVFEELLAHSLAMQKLRHKLQQNPAPAFTQAGDLNKQFISQVGFELTAAQQRVLGEIQQDLNESVPMLRMVQGDVGSGKTVVAALSMLRAVENNYQAALMAPTEILAEQHYQTFKKWLQPSGIQLAWLSGNQNAAVRREQLALMTEGKAKIIIGTHALFQASVQFEKLGLVVIDEQHRFGVHQRLALRNKGMQRGQVPHQLVMTATPIPRSLAMTAYGDLEYSVIDELPPGRTPVATVAIANDRRQAVIERVAKACEAQRQAYWVCTLIEESEVLQCQAAEATAAQLTQELPHLCIALVHGRMPTSDKEAIMQRFKQGNIDLLVATTVIEVGVDVPNASLMIIENPERLGLAQLHQLRGRVGRGSLASHCVLMYQSPLSLQGRERLQVMRETNDGFIIAQKDLSMRGPGEVLGTRQTGMMQFKVADIVRDHALLTAAKQAAKQLLSQDKQAAEEITQRWYGQRLEYHDV